MGLGPIEAAVTDMADTATPRELEGDLSAAGAKFGIVVSRFNSLITDRLLSGALDAIGRNGGDVSNVDVARVPGSLELPVAAQAMIETERYDAVICLGAVIRGETSHYDHVASEAARGIAEVSRESGVPVVFGVLTCDTLIRRLTGPALRAETAGSRPR